MRVFCTLSKLDIFLYRSTYRHACSAQISRIFSMNFEKSLYFTIRNCSVMRNADKNPSRLSTSAPCRISIKYKREQTNVMAHRRLVGHTGTIPQISAWRQTPVKWHFMQSQKAMNFLSRLQPFTCNFPWPFVTVRIQCIHYALMLAVIEQITEEVTFRDQRQRNDGRHVSWRHGVLLDSAGHRPDLQQWRRDTATVRPCRLAIFGLRVTR